MKHIRPTINDIITNILVDEYRMLNYKKMYSEVHSSSAEAIEYNMKYWQLAASANTLRELIGEPRATYWKIYEGGNKLYLNNPSSVAILSVMETN